MIDPQVEISAGNELASLKRKQVTEPDKSQQQESKRHQRSLRWDGYRWRNILEQIPAHSDLRKTYYLYSLGLVLLGDCPLVTAPEDLKFKA